MEKYSNVKAWSIIFMVGLLVFVVGILCGPSVYYMIQQRVLAYQLGVDASEYPLHPYFPLPYYEKILTKGMTITETHQIIEGYRKVFRCGNVQFPSSEIYYYFSNDDNMALRFEVEYDKGKLVWVEGEDDDSRDIRVDNCEEGRFSD